MHSGSKFGLRGGDISYIYAWKKFRNAVLAYVFLTKKLHNGIISRALHLLPGIPTAAMLCEVQAPDQEAPPPHPPVASTSCNITWSRLLIAETSTFYLRQKTECDETNYYLVN
jgi:hypothetical protein